MTPQAVPPEEDHLNHAMLQRPESHLEALSVAMKWETTRRHPLYVWLWGTWRVYQRKYGDQAAAKFQDFPGCQWAWLMLGINGVPVDPALDLAEIGEAETNARWLRRSARPVTYRLLAKVLEAKLSSDALRLLSTMLFAAANTDAGSLERDQKLMSLNSVDWPELDALVDQPLLLYNPAAPSKEFISDITNLRNEKRRTLEIEESRTSETKMQLYLDAWDAREGWRSGGYDRSAPMTLKSVAKELAISDRKAKYAYQQGFQLISGHSFSLQNWMRLIGVLHLSGHLGGDVNLVSLSRLRHAPSVRGTDDTTLSMNQTDCSTSFLENLPGGESDFNASTALKRINQMIRIGCPNDHILAELGLDALAEPAIDELRSIVEMEGG